MAFVGTGLFSKGVKAHSPRATYGRDYTFGPFIFATARVRGDILKIHLNYTICYVVDIHPACTWLCAKMIMWAYVRYVLSLSITLPLSPSITVRHRHTNIHTHSKPRADKVNLRFLCGHPCHPYIVIPSSTYAFTFLCRPPINPVTFVRARARHGVASATRLPVPVHRCCLRCVPSYAYLRVHANLIL